MRKHIVTYIPVTVLAGLAVVGGLQTMGYQFSMTIPYTTTYALFFSAFVYALMVSNQGMLKFSFDSMIAKRLLSAVVGLAIIGFLWYNDYEYERASIWSALLSSTVFIYMVIFGPNIPPEINPLFFE
jgi:hypothetical protein